jgi:hypothetical protein
MNGILVMHFLEQEKGPHTRLSGPCLDRRVKVGDDPARLHELSLGSEFITRLPLLDRSARREEFY